MRSGDLPLRACQQIGVEHDQGGQLAGLGQDAAAEQRLTDVAQRFGTTDEAPLARFYLVQLYLWAGNQAAASFTVSVSLCFTTTKPSPS